MTRNTTRATLTEKLKIMELLSKFLKPVGDGTFEYAAPWDDVAVSRQVNEHFSASHTASVRNELHGPLRASKKQRDTVTLERFTNIEARLTELEDQVNALEEIRL